MEELLESCGELGRALKALSYPAPITHIYNPLDYARRPFATYLRRYGQAPKEVLFLGMNPGPWGMAQTGIPFGEVATVKRWLGIDDVVETPADMHPKRPILGMQCTRSEVSGARLWGWAEKTFVTPASFFSRFFVYNYCPLSFMEESGKNVTPDKLPKALRTTLFGLCDAVLSQVVTTLRVTHVVGIGAFARERAASIKGLAHTRVSQVLHPSPASPLANRGWAEQATLQLRQAGILIP